MFVLLGDSHTRSYSVSKHIYTCVFINSGKYSNLSSIGHLIYYTSAYLINCFYLNRSLAGFSPAIVIGEPDLRYILYGRWNIFSIGHDHKIDEAYFKRSVGKFVKRFSLFLGVAGFFGYSPRLVIGSGTPNESMCDYSLYMNHMINIRCEENGLVFFDPQDAYMRSGDANRYVGNSVFNAAHADMTHFGKRISEDLDFFLDEKGLMVNDGFANGDITMYFSEIKNFKTFKLKKKKLLMAAIARAFARNAPKV